MGGEFAVLLPGTPKANAQIVIDRLRERLADYPEALSLFHFDFHVVALHEEKAKTTAAEVRSPNVTT